MCLYFTTTSVPRFPYAVSMFSLDSEHARLQLDGDGSEQTRSALTSNLRSSRNYHTAAIRRLRFYSPQLV
jgi:hypothetical protein